MRLDVASRRARASAGSRYPPARPRERGRTRTRASLCSSPLSRQRVCRLSRRRARFVAPRAAPMSPSVIVSVRPCSDPGAAGCGPGARARAAPRATTRPQFSRTTTRQPRQNCSSSRACVRPAVDDRVFEDRLRGRVVGPVVRGRAQRPVRGDGGLDVVSVQGQRECGSQELEPSSRSPGSADEEALSAQAARLEIRVCPRGAPPRAPASRSCPSPPGVVPDVLGRRSSSAAASS